MNTTLDLPPILPVAPNRSSGPLTQPASTRDPLKLTRILVPTDFSEPARKAIRYAAQMAGQFGATITLLHVFELPTYAQSLPEYPTIYQSRDDLQSLYADAKVHAEERLAALRDQLSNESLTADVLMHVGTPYEHIVQAARETAADLIVIATHGYTGLKHLFLGSTAERVVRHAPCPVLVVREHERDFVPTTV